MHNREQHKLSQKDVKILSREIPYQGYFRIERFQLQHRLFAGGWSPVLTRELFERGNAAGVLLYDPFHQQVVMIEQFRVGACISGVNPWLLEIVAGIINSEETPVEVVKREAIEEAGVIIKELIPIHRYFSSPGGSTEYVDLFCGQVDATQADGIHGLAEENEDIRVCVMSLDEVFSALQKGRINNAASIIAVQWLQLNLEHVRQQWQ